MMKGIKLEPYDQRFPELNNQIQSLAERVAYLEAIEKEHRLLMELIQVHVAQIPDGGKEIHITLTPHAMVNCERPTIGSALEYLYKQREYTVKVKAT